MSSDSSGQAAIQERLDRLGLQFLRRTEREVASLRGCLLQIRGGDTQALTQMQHLAHKIHGTGATLGFAAIGDCAAALERLAEAALGAGTADPSALELLAQSIAQLQSEVERDVART